MLRKQLSRKWEGPQNFICPGATKRLVTPLPWMRGAKNAFAKLTKMRKERIFKLVWKQILESEIKLYINRYKQTTCFHKSINANKIFYK